MLAFPGMLVSSAEEAGMKVPPDPDKFDKKEFPHFFVFCQLQLGRAMDWDEPWSNAKMIVDLPEEKLKKMTMIDFIAAGLRFKT